MTYLSKTYDFKTLCFAQIDCLLRLCYILKIFKYLCKTKKAVFSFCQTLCYK